jgi:O-antigen biosynthesis alpha-1,2-rhamnosyltransferase
MFPSKNERGMPRCIYIDCTETYYSPLNTGIQRVVRNIAVRAKYLSRRFGVPCIPVVAFDDGYLPLFAINLYWKYEEARPRILENGKHFYAKLKRLYKREERTEQQEIIEQQDKRPIENSSYLRLIIKTMVKVILGLTTRIVNFYIYSKVLRPKKGELLALADAFWGYNKEQTVCLAENAYLAGATVIPVIYDLIPLLHPEYCDDENVLNFSKEFQKIVKIASGMLAISATTQKDVGEYLQRFYPEKVVSTDFFYLGADFEESKGVPLEIKIRPDFEKFLHEPFFLMVGTIEPRRAHAVVLTAFENFWEKGGSSRLCIVGKVGWKGADIQRKMSASPYRDRFLFIWHDVSDQELGLLYQRARGVILASFTEGFGLPMVEAMRYGRPVIASDIPIFREIAGSYPTYFRMGDSDDLAQVIRNFDQGSPTEPNPPPWLTWDESATMFMERLLLLYKRIQH